MALLALNVFTPVPDAVKAVQVKLPFKVTVPADCVNVPVQIRSSVTVTTPLVVMFTLEPIVKPAEVIVLLPEPPKLVTPVLVYVMPETKVKLPEQFICDEPVRAPVKPVQSKPAQGATAVIVQVPPALPASKKTASADVGTDAPPAPPLEADQLAVFVVSQLPVPTQ